ncbi:hypothetical protein ACK8P5_26305 (plasmid) [Paenibacillus sp. EC2-1]|uniref:hypothetical protein n=1 Tax=Paenibacillus sp. EC2-1 TaxID=3388665 RepID=UPI003BEF46D5
MNEKDKKKLLELGLANRIHYKADFIIAPPNPDNPKENLQGVKVGELTILDKLISPNDFDEQSIKNALPEFNEDVEDEDDFHLDSDGSHEWKTFSLPDHTVGKVYNPDTKEEEDEYEEVKIPVVGKSGRLLTNHDGSIIYQRALKPKFGNSKVPFPSRIVSSNTNPEIRIHVSACTNRVAAEQILTKHFDDFYVKHHDRWTESGVTWWRNQSPGESDLLQAFINFPLVKDERQNFAHFVDDFYIMQDFCEELSLLFEKGGVFAPILLSNGSDAPKMFIQKGQQNDILKAFDNYSKVLCYLNEDEE